MSFLLRPMIWYKFIGGMVALKGKYCFSSFPQPCLQMHITAFPNGVGHLSALWRTKRVARMWGCYIQLQQEAALRQTDMFRGKCLNFDAFVGCQTILPALVHDRADASAEGTSAKGDMGDRDHDRTCAREIVALHPQVGAGKRGSAVLLYIAETTFEAMHISIHSDAALECVGHAENAVPALHGEKTEWPHDIGTERRKRSVHDLTADAGQLNMAALARKPTSVRLYHTVTDGQIRHLKLSGTFSRDQLDKIAAHCPAGNECYHVIPFLMLKIPALKTFLSRHTHVTAIL